MVMRLGHNTQLVLEAIISLVMLGLFAIVIWQTTVYALDAWHTKMAFETAKMPVFPFRLIIPVGLFFFYLQLLVKLVSIVTRLLPFSRNRLSDMRGGI